MEKKMREMYRLVFSAIRSAVAGSMVVTPVAWFRYSDGVLTVTANQDSVEWYSVMGGYVTAANVADTVVPVAEFIRRAWAIN